jgi:hypothetical protein
MSEVPMGGYGAPTPEQPEASAPKPRDPRLLIGGGIGLAVVAAAGAYLFLGGGGGGTATPAAVSPRIHHSATPTATATVIPVGKPTAAVRAFKGDVGRDPFQALVTPAPAAVTTSPKATSTAPVTSATATTPGTVVGPSGVPTGLPGGVTPTGTTPSTAIPTTTPPPAKVMVVLKAITFHGTMPFVVVSYTGVQYMMKTGDTAGASLKVLAIAPDDGSATFQLGDQTFDLHIGQSYVG